jgi:hypothetical protein
MRSVLTERRLILWLRAASVITVLTGLLASFASHPASDRLWLLLFDTLSWPLNGDPNAFDKVSRPLNAVLGGVMIGWGILMHGLLQSKIFCETIRKVMLRSLLLWFIADSIGSFFAEIPGNVLLNIAFLGMFLPPLLLLKQSSCKAYQRT